MMANKKSSPVWIYLTVLLAAMVGLAMTPLASAQDTQATPTPSQSSQQGQVTATGCLQKNASGSGYQITDTSSMQTYDLTAASSDVDLSAHVGHTVTVTGTPSAASASNAGTAGNPGSNPANPSQSQSGTSGSGSSSQPQQLSVTNVKMVSNTCSGGGL
jgi:hypothetical protein